MKRNMLTKKLTAGLLTGVMTMAMGMNALAATVNDPLTSAVLTKKVETDGTVYAPNTTFEFVLKPEVETTYEGHRVFPGVADGLTMGTEDTSAEVDGTYKATVTFSPDTSTAPSDEYFQTVSISVADAAVFGKPGIFHYTLQETPGSYPGMTYDSDERDLYVFVERVEATDELFVAGLIAVNESDTQYAEITDGKTGLTITNKYGTDEAKLYDLILTKEVTGNQGDKTLGFSFDLYVKTEDSDEKYYVEYGNLVEGEFVKDDRKPATFITASGEADDQPAITNVTLKHGEAVRINGLSSNDHYYIEEKEAKQGDLTGYTTKINDTVDEDRRIDGTLNEDSMITYENYKQVTTPTGIAMTFAPYAVMVAFAGVFAVMFLRKKKEDF